uniref:Emopamil-binding protein n=1 Tax=Caenorhabditis japonica TaxID=281687 RepID=A0A8R1DFW0_CAEJA
MSPPPLWPSWVTIWLIVSAVICLIDVVYTMGRPFTNAPDGFVANTVFAGWKLYSSVDIRYADTKDVVTCATGRVMLVEIALNFVAVYLASKRSRHAILLAFTTTAFVFWKTIWYLILYVNPPAGSQPFFTDNYGPIGIFLIFWIPNGIWAVVPAMVLVELWNKLALPVEIQEQHNNNYEKPPGLTSP